MKIINILALKVLLKNLCAIILSKIIAIIVNEKKAIKTTHLALDLSAGNKPKQIL